jgi:hypothetical protein
VPYKPKVAKVTNNMSPEKVASEVAAFRAAGAPEDQIAAAFAGQPGFTPPGQTAPEDKRTEDAKAIDVIAPPVSDPRAYDLGFVGRQGTVTTDDLTAALGSSSLNQAIREGFHAMNLPNTAARSIAEMMVDSATRFSRETDPAARALEHQHARFQLTQALGPEAVAEAAEAVKLWRAKSPAVVDQLAEAGYFTDARVLGQLALQTRRQKARG